MSYDASRRASRAVQNLTAIGVQGRKTGVSVQDTGQRNEDGFEDLDNFFSPEKTSAPPVPAFLESPTLNEQTATEATMQLAMSSGIEPKDALAQQRRETSLPPPRSPLKPFTVSGTPRRGSSVGPKSSPTQQLDATPVRMSSSPNKRLDFSNARTNNLFGGARLTSKAPSKPNSKSTSASKEREMSKTATEEPQEPIKKPVVAKKKLSIIEVAVGEHKSQSQPSEAITSSPPSVQKKKPTKRGLVARPAPKQPFALEEEDTEDDSLTTPRRDGMDEAVSMILDETTETPNMTEDVDMTDAPEDVTTHTDAPEEEEEEEEIMTEEAKAATPEPDPEATEEDEEMEPLRFKKRSAKAAPTKKSEPAKAPTPEPEGEEEEDEIEPQPKPKKRSAKSAPPPKKAPEPEPEETEVEEEEVELEPVKRGKAVAKKHPPAKKPAPGKSKKAQPEPEPEAVEADDEEEEVEQQASTKPAKKAAPTKKPPPIRRGKKAPEPELAPEAVEADDEEEEAEAPAPTKTVKKTAPAKKPSPVRRGKKVPEPEADDEEEEPAPTKAAKKKPSPAKKPTPTRRGKKAPEPEPEPESQSEPEAVEADGEETEAPAPKRKAAPAKKPTSVKRGKKVQPEPEAIEEEDAPASKKRAARGKQAEPTKSPARPARKAAKKAAEPEPEPEPEVPAKGRGKAKAATAAASPLLSKPEPRGLGGRAVLPSETESEPLVQTTKRARRTVPEPEEEEEVVEQPARKKARSGKKAPEPEEEEVVEQPSRKKARPDRKVPEPEAAQEEGEQLPKKKARKAAPKAIAPSKKPAASRVRKAAEPEPMDIDAEEAAAPRPQKGRGKAVEKPPSPRKERRIIREAPPAPQQSSEDGQRRSSRVRMAPLAFWKGEKVEYVLGSPADGGSVRMPSAVGVVRIEGDDEPAPRPKPKSKSKPKPAPTASPVTKKRKRVPAGEADSDSDSSDPGEPEPWEQPGVEDAGVKRGRVRLFPPTEDSDGEPETVEMQLAFTKERMVTIDVANGSFQFVKTHSQDNFGTGVIEIPPDGSKRTKNSGRMTLVFYMVKGRATVTIADNTFRIGRGGQFMVPPGNHYDIKNEYDTVAKMFFAQGCDPVAQEDESEDE